MASNENIGENSNASGSDNYSETNDEVQVNPMVLLVRIKHVDGRPIEPEILTEKRFMNSVNLQILIMSHLPLKF